MLTKDCVYDTFEHENNIENVLHDDLDLTPIQKFYDGATVFITGSTGFLGHILIEKLLRSCPTISTLYLLVRQKKGKSMQERLDEMFKDVIFSRLAKECPKFRHKVIGVAGDCALPDMGLSLQDRRLLIDETNVVFHVAATVRFDENIKTAVKINIRSPRDLVQLSKEMTKLKSLIHVSTAYANCPRNYIGERVYPPAIDGKKLMLMMECVPEKILDDITPRLLGAYPNTYAYTKQIAEDIVKQESDNMPVGIFRPAIVVSTYKEPLKAWINNMYGPTGVCAAAGVGFLRTMHCDTKANANLVPVDMCVNSLIASAWQVEYRFQKAAKEGKTYEIGVYNYESSNDRPISWGAFMHLSKSSGLLNPSIKSVWYYCFNPYKLYTVYLLMTFLLHTIPALITDTLLKSMGKSPRMMKAYKKLHKFSTVISYFSIREWTFQNDSVRSLLSEMRERDREIFFSDLKQLDWNDFFRLYLKGLRVYLIHDSMDTLPVARRKWNRFYYAHQFIKLVLVLVATKVLYFIVKFSLSWV